jgi:hypothetical protein
MTRSAGVDPPEVESWLLDNPSPGTEQYAGSVRGFIKKSGVTDFGTVATAQLVDFVISIGSEGSRRRAISALESFFGNLYRRGSIAADPALDLAARVREQAQRTVLQERLAAAGFPMEADGLSWRDVARAAVDGDPRRPHRMIPKDALPIVRAFVPRLLRKICRVRAEHLDEFLDRLV